MIMKAQMIADTIRQKLISEASGAPMDDVAVALSGGVDSTSVLSAFLQVGIRPSLISYTPSTHDSTDFMMAASVADRGRMRFIPSYVEMEGYRLEDLMRSVIAAGYHTKLQVECLVPMFQVLSDAAEAGIKTLFTGDQADGFFINNNWMARNFDRARGIPGPLRTAVSEDDDPWRIDQLRDIYWNEDRSCSEALKDLGRRHFDIDVRVPYRSEAIREDFRGALWCEVNRPRFKEPIRLAFPEWIDTVLPTRPAPVNLHRGDSYFSERFGKMMMDRLPGPWKTTTGLYAAIARGEV